MANHDDVLNFIDGQYQLPRTGAWIENVNPATGQVIGRVANSGAEDISAAVEASLRAQESWSQTTLDQRSAILHRIADLIDQNLELLARTEMEDSGKPISRAKIIEIPRAATNLRFFGSAITQFASEAHESAGLNALNITLRHPLGIVGCISPWNLPLYLLTWKVAPAIATGNCVIAKPSELTPRTAMMLGEFCNEAGLPKGVLNIVQGTGPSAGEAMLTHPGIKAISFTGSTATGKHIASVVAPQMKKYSLELGGKNPNIVFADCPYEKALNTTVHSSFGNQGQICLCGSRLFIESSIYEQFKNDLVDKAKNMVPGDPTSEATQIGSMISEQHHEKVINYIQMAKDDGARVLCGGNSTTAPGCEGGYFIEPTVIEVDSNQCRINQEEVFGPVVTLMPFENESELIQMANDVTYGLSATIWTSNLDRTMRLTRNIEAGVIWVNSWLLRDLRTPFGGMKSSGVGREGGLEALRFFTEPKNVCIAYE